jgi:uncharacterized protein YjbJ (UPF0337 family)
VGTAATPKNKGANMNFEQLEGKWKQVKGNVRERWGRLTDDDLEQIAGKREQLVGRIQERYGIMKEAAEAQVNEFMKTHQTEPETKGRAAGQR